MIYLVGTPDEVESYCKLNKISLGKPRKGYAEGRWCFHRGRLAPATGPTDSLVVLPSARAWGDRTEAILRRFHFLGGINVTNVTPESFAVRVAE